MPILGEITKNTQLLMEWLPHNYLKLMIQYGIKINMANYPGGNIVEPKKANVEHLQEAINGWKNGRIKWVELMTDELEQQKAKLSGLESEASQTRIRSESKLQTVYVAFYPFHH